MFKDEEYFYKCCEDAIESLEKEIEDLNALTPCDTCEACAIKLSIQTREKIVKNIQDVMDRVSMGEDDACEEIEDILTKHTTYKKLSKKYIVVDEHAFKLACGVIGKDIKHDKALSDDEIRPLIEYHEDSWIGIKELNSALILDAACNVYKIIDDLVAVSENYKRGKELTKEGYELLVRYLK